MRIVWVAAIWVLFIGGLLTYMLQRETATQSPADAFKIEAARGTYALVVTTTFAAQPDPFALTADDGDSPAALQIRMGSQILLQKTDDIQPGQPMRVSIEDGLVTGANEILIQASPPLDAGMQAQAVRIQILRDNLTVAERTFWAASGENISETFRFDIEGDPKEADHDH